MAITSDALVGTPSKAGFNNTPNAATNVLDNVVNQVAGIISLRPNAQFMSGARCALKINGKLVGFAFGISWTINTMVTEVNTIDDYLPYELAPQRVTVEGTISALHVPGQSPNTQGWQSDIMSFLFAPYISIEAWDEGTNQRIFATDKAMITTRSEEIRVDDLSNVTLRWRSIGYMDEKTPVTPHNYDKTLAAATIPPTTTAGIPPITAPSLNPPAYGGPTEPGVFTGGN
jgi:hypothetical protein